MTCYFKRERTCIKWDHDGLYNLHLYVIYSLMYMLQSRCNHRCKPKHKMLKYFQTLSLKVYFFIINMLFVLYKWSKIKKNIYWCYPCNLQFESNYKGLYFLWSKTCPPFIHFLNGIVSNSNLYKTIILTMFVTLILI